MYWYYKYPLLAVIILLLFGVCVFIWQKGVAPYLGQKQPKENKQPVQMVEVVPDAGASETLSEQDKSITAPVLSGDMQTLLLKAKKELQDEQLKMARETAREGLSQCDEYSSSWYEFAQVINDVNKIFMSGGAPCPEKKRYVIVAGDKLLKIAYNLNTTVEALQKLNSLSLTSSVIHPGNPLVYIDGEWSIKVSKKHFILILYLDGQLYRFYKISTGRQDRTPTGNFIISQKQMNPTWTYAGEVIPFGDERNVLGTRWIGLQPTDEINAALRGYGIHGTTEPENIGKPASLGCVRMLNEEVEELYDFIPSSFNAKPINVTIVEE